MKADFIYRHLQHETGLSEVSLCMLHKPCVPTMRCDTPQQTRLLNFDEVKDIWNSLHPEVATPASVDGLTYRKDFDSIRICEDFAKVDNLHELFPIEYLVVTDLQRNDNPLLNLMENLNFLGNNSSDWATYYMNILESRVGSVNVKGVIPKLVCCKEFDTFLEKL